MTTVTTIIVNYRTPDITVRCLESLMPGLDRLPGSNVIVVDNDSGDGSLESIRRAVCKMGAGARVNVLASDRNGGFAYGVNIGVRHATSQARPPDSIYLLNSDAFPAADALEGLIEFQRRNSQAAMVGSYVHGIDGKPHCTSFRFPTILGELIGNLRPGRLLPFLRKYQIAVPYPSQPTKVDWVAGASMLIRRQVFEEVGLFDDNYFLYYEETDFCKRAARAGFETWYFPGSSVAHIGSASTGLQEVGKPRGRYWFESRKRYFLIHHGAIYLLASNVVWVSSFLLWKLRCRIQRPPAPDPPRLLRDFIRYSFRPSLRRA